MAAKIFEPGKSTSTTTQPATPAKREAVLAWLKAIASSGRDIGGYRGGNKPAIKMDLSSLIKTIESNPDALTKIIQQSGRPASPSPFQTGAQGLTTLAMLAKLGFDVFGSEKTSSSDKLNNAMAEWLMKQMGMGGGDFGGVGGSTAGDFNIADILGGSGGDDFSISGGATLDDYGLSDVSAEDITWPWS